MRLVGRVAAPAEERVIERHPGLEPGESYTAPDGLFKISVISANLSSARVEISFPGLRKVARWSGKDRYAASVEMSQQSFAPGVDRVLIASGEVYTDALSGAPVGGRDGDPILLTKADELPSVVEAELRRLDPASVVILGGPATISDRVASRLASVTGVTPQRWSGADRFVTSAQISERSYEAGGVDTAYVASGRVFPDALSGAPASGLFDDLFKFCTLTEHGLQCLAQRRNDRRQFPRRSEFPGPDVLDHRVQLCAVGGQLPFRLRHQMPQRVLPGSGVPFLHACARCFAAPCDPKGKAARDSPNRLPNSSSVPKGLHHGVRKVKFFAPRL